MAAESRIETVSDSSECHGEEKSLVISLKLILQGSIFKKKLPQSSVK